MDLSLRPENDCRPGSVSRPSFLSLQRRGALICVLSALGLLLLIALLDRLWLVPDAIRPWVSLAAYAACAYAGWRLAWQFLSQVRDNAGAARAAELRGPGVARKAAVGGGAVSVEAAQVKDSPEFRASCRTRWLSP